MTIEEIKPRIGQAYKKLLKEDAHLFNTEVNERSITHKFAEKLHDQFPDWDVDCEYNRNGFDTKTILSPETISSDDRDAVSVYPDIIIHHRGTENNLIVIEAKKSNYRSKDNDENKLKRYKNVLGYKFAIKIVFPVRDDFKTFDDSLINIKYVDD